ncbi:Putative mycofactocin radical SAM maturase MftC [Phycisphaerales bacterium]|nr:Putative mycofactocin radical SAM maturase MftC [Phycisphaerales bacterium]
MALMSQPKTVLVSREGVPIYCFGHPRKRWVLWHITSGCNLECVYCYGSFEGGSYKKNYRSDRDLPLATMLTVADDVASLGFTHVHINGGEPLLRRETWNVADRLRAHGLQVWVLTNGTVVSREIQGYFESGCLDCLAFSIDSIRPEYGNAVREKTEMVLKNIPLFARWKAQAGIATRLGAYVVLTRKNLDHVSELIQWLVEIGVQYVNMQTVHLPIGHPDRSELMLTSDCTERVLSVLDILERSRGRIETSSDALLNLTRSLIQHGGGAVNSCFAEEGNYLYLSPDGSVHGCPSKPPMANAAWGNVRKENLRDIITARRSKTPARCPHVSLDCLGMYEMAFQAANP